MKTILAAILFAFLHTAAISQVIYTVTDALDAKRNRQEVWMAQRAEDKESLYEVVKEDAAKKELFEKHIQKKWFREIHQAGQLTYFRERLTLHPTQMENGERSYGYIEERNVKTDQVVNSFPVFYSLATLNALQRVIFKIYLPDGIEEVVTRDFYSRTYSFPFYESRVVSQYGVVQSHLIYKREN